MPNYNKEPGPKPCVVVISGNKTICGVMNWGWTNHMEPICLEHFRQRLFLQRWMVNYWGAGNWGWLVARQNPQMFMDVEEPEDSQKRRNLSHIRNVKEILKEKMNDGS